MKKRTVPVRIPTSALGPTRIERNPFPGASVLRAHFDRTFENPHHASARRFCWDYWTVPGQYRLLRTPAESFFPKDLYQPFLSRLLHWGRNRLGCQMISHPWLSAYTDGCHQNLHSDVPHGPFSFVYSLTRWDIRRFTGGETLLAKPKLLRYFSEISHEQSHEESDFFESIPQSLGQLAVFDPRYPHGVRPVHGVDSILDSRLVIHGWFTDPRPMLEGSLTERQIRKSMDELALGILERITSQTSHSGLLTLRLGIRESGEISGIEIVTAHLPDDQGRIPSPARLRAWTDPGDIRFPRSRGRSLLTLPLHIQR